VVELDEGEAPEFDFVSYQAGDEEAGDNEEYVNANKAAAKHRYFRVEEHHDEDGDGSQAVDVFPVWHE
jgi:hypothetical protein